MNNFLHICEQNFIPFHNLKTKLRYFESENLRNFSRKNIKIKEKNRKKRLDDA